MKTINTPFQSLPSPIPKNQFLSQKPTPPQRRRTQRPKTRRRRRRTATRHQRRLSLRQRRRRPTTPAWRNELALTQRFRHWSQRSKLSFNPSKIRFEKWNFERKKRRNWDKKKVPFFSPFYLWSNGRSLARRTGIARCAADAISTWQTRLRWTAHVLCLSFSLTG